MVEDCSRFILHVFSFIYHFSIFLQTHINEGFAKLSEALYIADRKARESVEARAQLEKRVAQHKKLEQEARMREMAAKARQVGFLST